MDRLRSWDLSIAHHWGLAMHRAGAAWSLTRPLMEASTLGYQPLSLRARRLFTTHLLSHCHPGPDHTVCLCVSGTGVRLLLLQVLAGSGSLA